MSTTPNDNNQQNAPQMPNEVQQTHLFLTGLAQRYDGAVRDLGALRFGIEAALNMRAGPDDVLALMGQTRGAETAIRNVGEGLMMLQFMMKSGQLAKYVEWRNSEAPPPPQPPAPPAANEGDPKTVDDL